MAVYAKYTHVERLGTEECEGLLDNDCVYVSSKIDGTNACVFWDEETGALGAGSRTRTLSAESDNAGFFAWATGDAQEAKLLREYCRAHPAQVVYGEWMGKDKLIGSFKGYDKRALGTLFIYDVLGEEAGGYLPEPTWREELAKAGLEPYFVKLLAVLDHPTEVDVLDLAKRNDFLIEGTGKVGEGVVCKVSGWKNQFGRMAYGKIVLDEFKRQGRKPAFHGQVEPAIIEAFVTDAEIEKTIAKVCVACGTDEFDPASRKMMGMLISFSWKDLLGECPNWARKFRNPKVDLGTLQGLCSRRVGTFAAGKY